MNIQVTNSSKIIESRHYEEFLAANEQEHLAGGADVPKLLALKRHLTVKPAELELMSLCKSNQSMRRVVLQAKQICLSEQDPATIISRLVCLLEKY